MIVVEWMNMPHSSLNNSNLEHARNTQIHMIIEIESIQQDYNENMSRVLNKYFCLKNLTIT